MNSVEVEILGKRYRFRTDDPIKIQDYAKYLNETLDEIASRYGLIEGKDILSFASILITEKYFQATETNEQMKKEIDKLNEKISGFLAEVEE